MKPDISPADQQTIKLGEFIIFLTDHTLDWQKDKNKVQAYVQAIYTDDYQHRYSYLNYQLERVCRNNEEAITVLGANLNTLECKLLPVLQADAGLKNACIKLIKLCDHMNLEIARMIQKDSIRSQFESLKGELKQVQSRQHKLAQKVLAAKNELKTTQQQYIAVLGIFASIVLAFTGSLSFSNSVFSNLQAAPASRLCLAGLFHLVFLLNTLYFLSQLVLKERMENTTLQRLRDWITEINILLVLAIYITASCMCL